MRMHRPNIVRAAAGLSCGAQSFVNPHPPPYNRRGMLLRIVHILILCFYLTAPLGAVLIDALRARKTKRTAPGAWLVGVVLAGVIVGTAISVLYALAVGGRV